MQRLAAYDNELLFVSDAAGGPQHMINLPFPGRTTSRRFAGRSTSKVSSGQAVEVDTQQPDLQSLFEWRRKQLQDHHRPGAAGYETAMHELRTRRGWALGKVRWLPAAGNAAGPTGIPDLHAAHNDQQSVGRAPLLTGLFEYLMLKGMTRSARSEYRDVDVGAHLET